MANPRRNNTLGMWRCSLIQGRGANLAVLGKGVRVLQNRRQTAIPRVQIVSRALWLSGQMLSVRTPEYVISSATNNVSRRFESCRSTRAEYGGCAERASGQCLTVQEQ